LDLTALKHGVDLLTLVEQDLGMAWRRSGRWYRWPCPFHDDGTRDGGSLVVTPDTQTFYCFGCGARGDVLDWLQRREGRSFREALAHLAELSKGQNPFPVASAPHAHGETSARQTIHRANVATSDGPTAAWRQAALAVVEECEAVLWSVDETGPRTYLRTERGLTDDTIRRWRLGYSRRKQTIAGLRVPLGIVIPWTMDGEVWQVKIRRPPGCSPKYLALPGGHPVLFGVDQLAGRDMVVLTEGEFDAMLLHQEAGQLVDVATLGSASKALTPRAIRYLLPARRWLLAYDRDAAGEDGTSRLAGLSARVRIAKPLAGKDLTDFWRAGGDLYAWTYYHVNRDGLAKHRSGSEGWRGARP